MTKIPASRDVIDLGIYNGLAARSVLEPISRWGYRTYRRTGRTPRVAYRAVRKLYGAPSELPFSRLAADGACERPLLRLPDDPPGLLRGSVERTVERLRLDGVVVLDRRLPEEDCADLEDVARRVPCLMIGQSGVLGRGRFDERAPAAVRYDVDEEDVLQSMAAQRVVADESLLAVAQGYLGAAPIQDLVAMWWSAPGGGRASSAAAQQFHFDLDRLRFLKVFVFLTDVDADTGPHVFVRGTHRTVAPELRRDRRHSDELVHRLHGDQVMTITGPRGTIFLADTRGLHKGQDLRSGHRLVFQTEYSSSLFGSPYGTPAVQSPIGELCDAAQRYPWAFQRFRNL